MPYFQTGIHREEAVRVQGAVEMKIGLIDVDSHNFPNIALMKISAYHKLKGDLVEFATMFEDYDIIYKSKIFDFTPDDEYYYRADKIFKGGTGYEVKSKLPENIENLNIIDYNLYNFKFSVQRFSIGCVRKCEFCVVPAKEGLIKPQEAYNFNPNGEHVEILDNNFFANPLWESAISVLKNHNQPVNFHGVDIRILSEKQCIELNKLRHIKQIKIAWDNPSEPIDKKIKNIIKYIKPYKLMCYVLIGFDSTPEQDLFRVYKLRELGIDPFVMPYIKNDNYQKRFARWVNHKAIFKTVKWADYDP